MSFGNFPLRGAPVGSPHATFQKYFGDSNMCNCSNKERAEAWDAVAAALSTNNARWINGRETGTNSAVREIERLYRREKEGDLVRTLLEQSIAERERLDRDVKTARAASAAWSDAHTRVLNERNAQRERADGAEQRLREERKTRAETVRLLERERAAVREFQHETASPAPRISFAVHRQNVSQAAAKYDSTHVPGRGGNHPKRVANAVSFLLNRVEALEAAQKDAPVPAGLNQAQNSKPDPWHRLPLMQIKPL